MPNIPRLIQVFEEAKLLLSRSDNDFMYSGWDDAAEALAEIDQVLDGLREGKIGSSIYFLPTGPLQEVSLSSGWGDEFTALADRYDAAMSAVADEHCYCQVAPGADWEIVADLGMDASYAEVTVLRCPRCGQLWLRYFYENEAFTGSGRWYLGPVSGSNIAVDKAKGMFAGMAWYFRGGSYYGDTVSKASGPLPL